MESSQIERVIARLWQGAHRQPDQFLCAIVDAAREPTIHRTIVESDSDHWCLIAGDIPLDLAEAAPYLVIFEEGAALLQTLIERGWGDSWGVFLTAQPPFEGLLETLRSHLVAQLPDGERVHLRYYDPRVARRLLPTFNAAELETFFGPVTCWFVENEDDERIVEYSHDPRFTATAEGLVGIDHPSGLYQRYW